MKIQYAELRLYILNDQIFNPRFILSFHFLMYQINYFKIIL